MLIKESKLRKIIRQELKSILTERTGTLDWTPPGRRPIPYVIAPGADKKEVYDFMRSHLQAKSGDQNIRLSGRNMRKYADKKILSQFRKWYSARKRGMVAKARKTPQKRVSAFKPHVTPQSVAAASADPQVRKALADAEKMIATLRSYEPDPRIRAKKALTRVKKALTQGAKESEALRNLFRKDPNIKANLEKALTDKEEERMVAPAEKPALK